MLNLTVPLLHKRSGCDRWFFCMSIVRPKIENPIDAFWKSSDTKAVWDQLTYWGKGRRLHYTTAFDQIAFMAANPLIASFPNNWSSDVLPEKEAKRFVLLRWTPWAPHHPRTGPIVWELAHKRTTSRLVCTFPGEAKSLGLLRRRRKSTDNLRSRRKKFGCLPPRNQLV